MSIVTLAAAINARLGEAQVRTSERFPFADEDGTHSLLEVIPEQDHATLLYLTPETGVRMSRDISEEGLVVMLSEMQAKRFGVPALPAFWDVMEAKFKKIKPPNASKDPYGW